MNGYLLVFLGAGMGGAMRHWVNLAAARTFGPAFPWGTLAVNVVGSFAMGLLAGYLAHRATADWTQSARLFIGTGVLGGFTTFSAFSLDVMVLWERGQAGLAAGYVLGSVVLSIAGIVAGLALVRALT